MALVPAVSSILSRTAEKSERAAVNVLQLSAAKEASSSRASFQDERTSALSREESELALMKLSALRTQMQADFLAGEKAIQAHFSRLADLLTTLRAAELRRARQHIHQCEVHLDQMRESLETHSADDAAPFETLLKLIIEEDFCDTFSAFQVHAYDIDVKFIELVRSSIATSELPLPAQIMARRQRGGKELQQSEPSLASKDYLALQVGLENCRQALRESVTACGLRRHQELVQRVSAAREEQARRVNMLMTADAASVQALFAEYRSTAATAASEVSAQQRRISLFALVSADSVSLATAKLCAALAKDSTSRKTAAQWYQRSLALLKQHFPTEKFTTKVLSRFGSLKLAEKQYEEAQRLLAEALGILTCYFPASARVHSIHAKLCVVNCGLGALAQAEANYEAAAMSRPREKAEAQCRLGRVYLERGNLEKARLRFTESLTNCSPSQNRATVKALMGLGRIALLSEDFRTAEQQYEKALTIATSHPALRPTTAKIYYDIGVLYERTERNATDYFLLSVSTLNAASDELTCSSCRCAAKAYARLGELEAAQRKLEEATHLLLSGAQTGVAWRKMGDSYEKLGLASQAVKCYNKAFELLKDGDCSEELCMTLLRREAAEERLDNYPRAEDLETELRVFLAHSPLSAEVPRLYQRLGESLRESERAAGGTGVRGVCRAERDADLRRMFPLQQT